MGKNDTRAAELALGLLEGEERRLAETKAGSDPEFAKSLAQWQGRLESLHEPQSEDVPEGLFSKIEAEIDQLESKPCGSAAKGGS